MLELPSNSRSLSDQATVLVILVRGVLLIWIIDGQPLVCLQEVHVGLVGYIFLSPVLSIFGFPLSGRGWSVGAKVLGKLSVPGRPTIWFTVGQGPTALAVGATGGCLDIFSLIYPFSPLSFSLWETARYRLKSCIKRPLNQKQPTNQLSGRRLDIA